METRLPGNRSAGIGGMKHASFWGSSTIANARQSGACGWGNFIEPSGDRQIIYIGTCIKVQYQNFPVNER